jgi:quercetin dioxygenase-like cupin family protein
MKIAPLDLVHPTILVGLLTAGIVLPLCAAVAESVSPSSPASESRLKQRLVISTGTTVTDQPIRYPAGPTANITAAEITLQPGQQTGWHMHPVPVFGYVLEGELTVDYGPKGQRTYRSGEGFVEALNEAHNGHNAGQAPVTILAIYIGAKGVQGTIPAATPAR